MLRKIIPSLVGSLLLLATTLPSHAQEIVVISGPEGETNASGEFMSADGTTIVGVAGSTWFLWTPEGGAVAIAEPGFNSVWDFSGDGNTILGNSTDGFGLWTNGDGFNLLNIPTPEGHE